MISLKIALISNPYFPVTGGPSSDTFNLAQSFYCLGHKVTIFAPFYPRPPFQDDGNVEVVRFSKANSLASKINYLLRHPTPSGVIEAKVQNHYYSMLSEFLKKHDFDVLHSRGVWCHALETNPAKSVTKVLTFGTMPTRKINPFCRKLIEFSFSEIDYRVAVWEGLKYPLESLEGIKIDKVIENGVNASFFFPIQKESRDHFTIGTVLKFAYKRKVDGLYVLLSAFSKLVNAGRKVKLKIAGDGPLRNNVEEIIKSFDLNVGRNIDLLGELAYSDMPRFYNSLDLYAHISFQDAGPNTLLEAMSSGLPALANDVGIVAQVVDDTNGWIVQPTTNEVYQKLTDAIDLDECAIADKGKNARLKVQDCFSWKKTAEDYLQLYRQGPRGS